MSYIIILKGRWCDVFVLNVYAPTEVKIHYMDSFYEELERISYKFTKYRVKDFLGNFNAKVGKKDIFKPIVENENIHEISIDNGIRVANFVTSKNLVVKSSMFPHRKFYKFIWTSPSGKFHNRNDHILIERRRNASVLEVRSFRAAYCDTII
jgi:hypothetical protein